MGSFTYAGRVLRLVSEDVYAKTCLEATVYPRLVWIIAIFLLG